MNHDDVIPSRVNSPKSGSVSLVNVGIATESSLNTRWTRPRRLIETVVAYWLGRTLRIRRRRAEDVADTTDSLRAVACIRFVRPAFGVWHGSFRRLRRRAGPLDEPEDQPPQRQCQTYRWPEANWDKK
jgi:hypothetical protein